MNRRVSETVIGLMALAVVGCENGDKPQAACSEVASPLTASAKLFLTVPMIGKLQARAAAKDPAWIALKKQCDAHVAGQVYAPNGNAYPNGGSIGQGYQGDGYLEAIRTLGLCYRTTKGVDDAAAAKYAATGTKVLEVMSAPVGSGGAKPSKSAAKKPAKSAEAAPAAAAASAADAGAIVDDITLIGGVGPALKKKLEGAGITSLTQIAAMDVAAMAALDAELKLGGRTEREEWIEQAKELLAGKPPRAKIDQKAAKDSE